MVSKDLDIVRYSTIYPQYHEEFHSLRVPPEDYLATKRSSTARCLAKVE
jgi:hypothetical protein